MALPTFTGLFLPPSPLTGNDGARGLPPLSHRRRAPARHQQCPRPPSHLQWLTLAAASAATAAAAAGPSSSPLQSSSRPRLLFCIDVGTSGVKAAALALPSLLPTATAPATALATTRGAGGIVTQAPSDWWAALTAAAARLTAALGGPVPATSILAKLAWLDAAADGWGGRGTVGLGAADYLVWRLTGGAVVCDATTLGTTGLTAGGGGARSVDERLLAAAGLGDWAHRLPCVPAGGPAVAGHVSVAAAAAVGVAALAGVPVVHAGGDAATVTAGAGASPYVYVGTSGWIGGVAPVAAATATAKLPPPPSPSGSPAAAAAAAAATAFELPHAYPGQALRLASMTSAGANVAFARSVLRLRADGSDGGGGGSSGPPSYAALAAAAASAPVGSRGVAYLPHLAGERCPFVSSTAAGSWVGLHGGVGAADLARAVYEGVALNYRALAGVWTATGGAAPVSPVATAAGVGGGGGGAPPSTLHLVGGGASPFFGQLLADTLRTRIVLGEGGGVGVRGAGVLAAAALGEAVVRGDDPPSAAAGRRGAGAAPAYEPRPAAADVYDALAGVWGGGAPALAAMTQGLAAFR
ncbi:hypothetical protein I4F81_001051 [Pyropia yezoensis]|uniref:Uncharacterized protein n=1 Tax=Pyropia yezoensis TaxID=2788 RepID=A0ACC3BL33_PYRYE|nr:hypothetical protein I4F81_001051 [Neopyropia yezoensis]